MGGEGSWGEVQGGEWEGRERGEGMGRGGRGKDTARPVGADRPMDLTSGPRDQLLLGNQVTSAMIGSAALWKPQDWWIAAGIQWV